MNYTEKYHLPQWVKEDRIMMEDFNQMCSDIEAGLERNAAEAVRANAQTAADVQTAQSTADKAVADAAAAQRKADAAYAPSKPPYAVGTYTGTAAVQTITVGFRPSFVHISSATSGADSYTMASGNVPSTHLEFTASGFTVKPCLRADSGTPDYPNLVESQRRYTYIAFR